MLAARSEVPSLEERAGFVTVTAADPVRLEIPHSVRTDYLTHGLFRYVGKLAPPLMAYLIEHYTAPGDLVVDPMCGGGTTAIEAVSSGRPSVGFDINPVSRLVTQALSDARGWQELSEFGTRVADEAAPAKPPAVLANYFSDEAYGVISHAIAQAQTPAEQVMALSIARTASFANTKKINTVVDKTKTPKEPRALLRAASLKFLTAFAALASTAPAESTVFAAADTDTGLEAESAAFVLLHPPYLTNTAFSEVTQLQLLLLGHDPVRLRSKELAYRGSYFHVPNGLKKYLVGWHRTLAEAARILRPGGHVAVINGDGRIDGVRIPVGAITGEFAVDLGLKQMLRGIHVLNNQTGMTLSRRMSSHHVLVFEK